MRQTHNPILYRPRPAKGLFPPRLIGSHAVCVKRQKMSLSAVKLTRACSGNLSVLENAGDPSQEARLTGLIIRSTGMEVCGKISMQIR